MEDKITPEMIKAFILLVEKHIEYMEDDIETLNRFGDARRKRKTESMSTNILNREAQILRDDLNSFNSMNIKDIKNGIFHEKFMVLLEEELK